MSLLQGHGGGTRGNGFDKGDINKVSNDFNMGDVNKGDVILVVGKQGITRSYCFNNGDAKKVLVAREQGRTPGNGFDKGDGNKALVVGEQGRTRSNGFN